MQTKQLLNEIALELVHTSRWRHWCIINLLSFTYVLGQRVIFYSLCIQWW